MATLGATPTAGTRGSAALAAARTARATLAIGALAVLSVAFVVTRVLAAWRLGAGTSGHAVSLLGLRVGYPRANLAALVVLALAALGLTITGRALAAAWRELRAAHRVGRPLRAARATDGYLVLEDRAVDAFCAGLVRPRVYVTSAALARLDEGALAALLAHERHHARRRDPLRLAAERVLVHALFFLPWLRDLIERNRVLAELGADEAAAAASRPGLARAMLTFEGIDPIRVENLVQPASWSLPAGLCLIALGAIVLLSGLTGLAARFASGSASLALPLVSRQPCIVVLALLPAATAFLGLRAVGRMRASWLAASSPESSREPRCNG